MTDEEFERLKEAEKEHLRKKKRLRWTLEAVKTQNRLRGLVEETKRGTGRLLQETESLINMLRSRLAHQEARVEGALDVDPETDEERREERAEELVRQYKAAQSASIHASQPGDGSEVRAGSSEGRDGPEKTIGRMQPPGSEESSDEREEGSGGT